MADDQIKNIFYRPDYQPDRHYESTDTFTQPTPPSQQTPPTYLTPPNPNEEVLNKLTILLDVLDILPEKVRPIVRDITKILTAITIIDRPNYPDPEPPAPTPTPEEPGLIPQPPVTPGQPETPGETETPKPQEPNLPRPPSAEDTVPTPETVTPETSQETPDTLTLDDIFPKPTNIEIVNDPIASLAEILTDTYYEDLLGLKEDYTSKMDLAIQQYVQELLCAANSSALGYDNLLKSYDGDAVKPLTTEEKHLHDNIIRLQIWIDERSRQFAKTHGAENTLLMYRSLNAAYQQRKKYYIETYEDEYNG